MRTRDFFGCDLPFSSIIINNEEMSLTAQMKERDKRASLIQLMSSTTSHPDTLDSRCKMS